MITSDGTVTTVAGNGAELSKDNTGYYASFAYPLGMTIDATGALCVVIAEREKLEKSFFNSYCHR